MYSHLVFVSNDFGFGPMSRTFSVAKGVADKRPDLRITVMSSGKNDYLFSHPRVSFMTVDDPRSIDYLRQAFEPLDNNTTLVVSVMSRFALLAARELGLKTLLIDGLYWFWRNRPQEYDTADYQFRCVLPWHLDNFHNGTNIEYFVSPTEHPNRGNASQSDEILVSLNGFTTPFYKPNHDIYLNILAALVNSSITPKSLTIVGNESVKCKIEPLLSGVSFRAFTKDEYLSHLSSCRAIILNGGSNSFLEAISLGKNIAFGLPSNQSQYQLIVELSKATGKKPEQWCPALSLIQNHHKMAELPTEAEALDFWSEQIDKLLMTEDIDNKIAQASTKTLAIADDPNMQSLIKQYRVAAAHSLSQITQRLSDIATSGLQY